MFTFPLKSGVIHLQHQEGTMSDVFVFAGVVEPDDPLQIEDVKPVVACRGCLATEQPLRPLDHDLTALYNQLVGFNVCQSDIFPNFLCSFCRALLNKFTAFRNNCHSIQAQYCEIHSAGIQITQDVIKSNIKTNPYPELKITHLKNIELGNDDNLDWYAAPTGPCQNTQFISIDGTDNNSFKKVNNFHNISNTKKSSNEIELVSNLAETQNKSDKDKTEALDLEINIESTANETHCSDGENTNMSDDLNNDESDNLPLNNFISKNKTNLYKNDLIKTSKKVKEEIKSKSSMKSERKSSQKKIKDWAVKHKKGKEFFDDKSSTVNANPENKISNSKTESIKKLISKKKKSPSKGQKIDAEKTYNAKVVVLSKEDQINQIQSRKESLNYKRSKYKCIQCFRGFITELTYKNHMVRHEPNQGEHICDICFMRYETPKKLNEHCNNQHRYNFICNDCGVITKSNCNAKLHHDWHNGVKYDCKICGKSFDKPTSVTGHMHLSHGGSVTCSICNETFIGAKGLSTHMIKSHKHAIGAVCASCGVQFHSVSAMQRHRPQGDCDHTHRPCAVCGEGFQSEDLLQQHKLDAHKSGFTCDQCGKCFDSMLKYRCHFVMHNDSNAPFTSTARRGRGRSRNTADSAFRLKPVFMCEICGSYLTTKTSLEIHIRTHTGEKPFQCDHCDRRFNAKSILHLHMSKHLNLPAKEFACSFCGKLFNLPQNRDRHENGVHRKLRRFKCDICEKMYSEKVNLQAHIKTKHLGMPWPKRIRPPRRRTEKIC